MLRRFFLAQLTSLDLWRLQLDSARAAEERERLDAANHAAIAFRERQRAYWALTDALCKAEASINDPHVMDARAMKDYRSALKRALRSLEG